MSTSTRFAGGSAVGSSPPCPWLDFRPRPAGRAWLARSTLWAAAGHGLPSAGQLLRRQPLACRGADSPVAVADYCPSRETSPGRTLLLGCRWVGSFAGGSAATRRSRFLTVVHLLSFRLTWSHPWRMRPLYLFSTPRRPGRALLYLLPLVTSVRFSGPAVTNVAMMHS